MTEEQRFMFDVQGYLVVPGLLTKDEVHELLEEMQTAGLGPAQNNPFTSRLDLPDWGPAWQTLIDRPQILPFLVGLLGPKLRLDHAYGMAMRADGKLGGEGLHNGAGMFDSGFYYVTHRDIARNGMIVVSWALSDTPLGSGGFCCIPGSHKALYPVPKDWHSVHDNPMVKQIPLQAGDVVIFTEALTHGTMAWTNEKFERRAALLKYCPSYVRWSVPTDTSRMHGLTERQKLILEDAYILPTSGSAAENMRVRPPVPLENSSPK